MVKNVMFGTMDWQNRRGKPSKEWMDDGVGQTDKHSASWRRTDGNGELSGRYWTPNGASPWKETELVARDSVHFLSVGSLVSNYGR